MKKSYGPKVIQNHVSFREIGSEGRGFCDLSSVIRVEKKTSKIQSRRTIDGDIQLTLELTRRVNRQKKEKNTYEENRDKNKELIE